MRHTLLLLIALACAACAGSGTQTDTDKTADKARSGKSGTTDEGLVEERSTESFTDERPVPKVSKEDAAALKPIWELYRRGDPRWPLERDRYKERGEGAAYLLAANLLRHYMKVNEHRAGNAQALAAVKREMIEAGEAAAPNLIDLMILDRIPMRDDRYFIPDDITRKDCQEMLEGMGSTVTPALLRALGRPDLGIKGRRMLAQTLGGTEDLRVYQPLVDLLRSDPSWQVRADAASALAELGDKRAIGPLTEATKTDKDEFVVRQAGKAKLELLESDRGRG